MPDKFQPNNKIDPRLLYPLIIFATNALTEYIRINVNLETRVSTESAIPGMLSVLTSVLYFLTIKVREDQLSNEAEYNFDSRPYNQPFLTKLVPLVFWFLLTMSILFTGANFVKMLAELDRPGQPVLDISFSEYLRNIALGEMSGSISSGATGFSNAAYPINQRMIWNIQGTDNTPIYAVESISWLGQNCIEIDGCYIPVNHLIESFDPAINPLMISVESPTRESSTVPIPQGYRVVKALQIDNVGNIINTNIELLVDQITGQSHLLLGLRPGQGRILLILEEAGIQGQNLESLELLDQIEAISLLNEVVNSINSLSSFESERADRLREILLEITRLIEVGSYSQAKAKLEDLLKNFASYNIYSYELGATSSTDNPIFSLQGFGDMSIPLEFLNNPKYGASLFRAFCNPTADLVDTLLNIATTLSDEDESHVKAVGYFINGNGEIWTPGHAWVLEYVNGVFQGNLDLTPSFLTEEDISVAARSLMNGVGSSTEAHNRLSLAIDAYEQLLNNLQNFDWASGGAGLVKSIKTSVDPEMVGQLKVLLEADEDLSESGLEGLLWGIPIIVLFAIIVYRIQLLKKIRDQVEEDEKKEQEKVEEMKLDLLMQYLKSRSTELRGISPEDMNDLKQILTEYLNCIIIFILYSKNGPDFNLTYEDGTQIRFGRYAGKHLTPSEMQNFLTNRLGREKDLKHARLKILYANLDVYLDEFLQKLSNES